MVSMGPSISPTWLSLAVWRKNHAGCSKRRDFSPAQPWRLLHPPALSLSRQPLRPGTHLVRKPIHIALREGLFRDGGEVHQWMYDRFSMARALGQAGFSGIENRAAGESGIPRFATYQLEVVNGSERKPYSLYMEARRDASPDPSGTKRPVAS